MANAIKFSTSGSSNSIRKGRCSIGINNVSYANTSTTGFWNGIDPPAGGYIIYQERTGTEYDNYGYSAATIPNDAALILYAQQSGAAGIVTVGDALAWIATQPNLVCVNRNYQDVVTSDLSLLLDASYFPSYPTQGTTWYDLSGNSYNSTLTNGPVFNSLGVISFDNTNDYVQIPAGLDLNALAATRNMTICFIAKKLFYSTGGQNVGNSTVLAGVNNGYNNGFRITENNTGTPGTAFNGTPAYGFGSPALGNSLNITSPRTGVNTFSYVAFSQSNALLTGFINGSFSSVTLANPYSPGVSNGSIGRDTGAGVGWFGGYIGNFQIYNRALSQEEILQNYHQAPIVTSGLVLAVDAGNLASFENGTTSAYSLPSFITGTITNGVGFNNTNGGTWDFDGTDDFINFGGLVSSINFIYTNPFSTEVWMRWDGGSQPNNAGHLIGKTFVNYRSFLITDTNPGRITFRLDSNGQTTDTSNIISPNLWYHVVCTWNPTTFNAKIFVNGVERASTTNTLTDWTSTAGNFQIGNSPGENYYFNGNIAIGRVYNKTLSQSEISQNFNAQRSRFGV